MNAVLDIFAWPLALTALAAVPLALFSARVELRRRRAARVALGGPARRSDRAVLAGGLLVAGAVLLAALAFARPRWGSQEVPLEQRGIDLVIVLDVSRSMLAQDVKPSRAQAAADAVSELLTHVQGNRVGLVTFAGSAFPRSPLTTDTQAVRSLVQLAQRESALVRPGSDLGGAVNAALDLLAVEDRAVAQALLVVTDGEVQQADITAVGAAAGRARADRVRVYGAFPATEAPVVLPASSGGTDITRAQRVPLVALAEQTGGQVREIAQAPGLAVEFRRLQQTRFEETSRRASVERFPWFAAAALALLLAQMLLGQTPRSRTPYRGPVPRWARFRAGLLGALALTAVLLSGCTAVLGTPVYRAVAEGNRLYAQGRYEEALGAYDRAARSDPESPAIAYNRGLAEHRLERYHESYRTTVEAINDAADLDLVGRMEFSAGNSAVMTEAWVDARDRYMTALRLNPSDAAAKANLELVLMRSNAGRQPGQDEGQRSPDGSDDQPQQPGGQQGDSPQQQPGAPGGPPSAPLRPDGSGESGPTPPSGQAPQPADAGSGAPPAGDATTFEDAQAALEAALAALGPEISRDQALRILELARQANSLERRPNLLPQGGGAPPPR